MATFTYPDSRACGRGFFSSNPWMSDLSFSKDEQAEYTRPETHEREELIAELPMKGVAFVAHPDLPVFHRLHRMPALVLDETRCDPEACNRVHGFQGTDKPGLIFQWEEELSSYVVLPRLTYNKVLVEARIARLREYVEDPAWVPTDFQALDQAITLCHDFGTWELLRVFRDAAVVGAPQPIISRHTTRLFRGISHRLTDPGDRVALLGSGWWTEPLETIVAVLDLLHSTRFTLIPEGWDEALGISGGMIAQALRDERDAGRGPRALDLTDWAHDPNRIVSPGARCYILGSNQRKFARSQDQTGVLNAASPQETRKKKTPPKRTRAVLHEEAALDALDALGANKTPLPSDLLVSSLPPTTLDYTGQGLTAEEQDGALGPEAHFLVLGLTGDLQPTRYVPRRLGAVLSKSIQEAITGTDMWAQARTHYNRVMSEIAVPSSWMDTTSRVYIQKTWAGFHFLFALEALTFTQETSDGRHHHKLPMHYCFGHFVPHDLVRSDAKAVFRGMAPKLTQAINGVRGLNLALRNALNEAKLQLGKATKALGRLTGLNLLRQPRKLPAGHALLSAGVGTSTIEAVRQKVRDEYGSSNYTSDYLWAPGVCDAVFDGFWGLHVSSRNYQLMQVYHFPRLIDLVRKLSAHTQGGDFWPEASQASCTPLQVSLQASPTAFVPLAPAPTKMLDLESEFSPESFMPRPVTATRRLALVEEDEDD